MFTLKNHNKMFCITYIYTNMCIYMCRIHNGISIPNKTRNKSTIIYIYIYNILSIAKTCILFCSYSKSLSSVACALLSTCSSLIVWDDLPCAPTNETSLLMEWISPFARCVFQPYKSRFLEMVPIVVFKSTQFDGS